jgi:hypothetical protein
MFTYMQQEVRALLKHIISIVYFMRGAIQYEEMMRRTPGERQLFEEFISERMDIEKDNPFPNY